MGVPKKRRYDNASRAASAQQTRERIMQAALELFMAHHYDDITIAGVAERAGVSPQTVVLHFKTKDGLVDATAKWWQPQEEQLRETSAADPLEAAKKIVARYEQLGPATMRLLALEGRIKAIDDLLDNARKSHRDWVERTFGKQLGSGAARERRISELVVAYDQLTWSVLRRVHSVDETILAMSELARGVLESKGAKR